MTKKEISEIKTLFHISRCSISTISGCYVDAEKEKKSIFSNPFLSMDESAIFKYLEIFKKNLSGTIGKNLFNMDFPLLEEKDDGIQQLLMKLKSSKLQDKQLLNKFYDQIIETYNCEGNYLILLIHDVYDIPGKSMDMATLDDADEVYEYLMCMICPVALDKPGLSYDDSSNDFQAKHRDWTAGVPEIGFLFPAFDDRSANIHSLLYHAKSGKTMHNEFITDFLHCTPKQSSEDQKVSFTKIVERSLSDSCTFDTVKDIFSDINELCASSENDESLVLGKSNMQALLQNHLDTDTEFLQAWEDVMDPVSDDISISSVTTNGKCTIQMDNIEIKSENGYEQVIETQIINGRKCVVIPVEGEMSVNGIHIK